MVQASEGWIYPSVPARHSTVAATSSFARGARGAAGRSPWRGCRHTRLVVWVTGSVCFESFSAVSTDPSPLRIVDAPATAVSATQVREKFARWLHRATSVSPETGGDIVLAVYEALANVVDHAYAGQVSAGTMTVSALYHPLVTELEICIEDHGQWQMTGSDRTRGRGIALINALCQRPTIARAASGTTVHLHWTLAALPRA